MWFYKKRAQSGIILSVQNQLEGILNNQQLIVQNQHEMFDKLIDIEKRLVNVETCLILHSQQNQPANPPVSSQPHLRPSLSSSKLAGGGASPSSSSSPSSLSKPTPNNLASSAAPKPTNGTTSNHVNNERNPINMMIQRSMLPVGKPEVATPNSTLKSMAAMKFKGPYAQALKQQQQQQQNSTPGSKRDIEEISSSGENNSDQDTSFEEGNPVKRLKPNNLGENKDDEPEEGEDTTKRWGGGERVDFWLFKILSV